MDSLHKTHLSILTTVFKVSATIDFTLIFLEFMYCILDVTPVNITLELTVTTE